MVRKNEFITAIVKKVDGLTKKDTAIILDAISETITECLVAGGKGEKINLPGLGSLEVRERAGRSNSAITIFVATRYRCLNKLFSEI